MKMTKRQSLMYSQGNDRHCSAEVTPSEDDAITNVLYFARALVMLYTCLLQLSVLSKFCQRSRFASQICGLNETFLVATE